MPDTRTARPQAAGALQGGGPFGRALVGHARTLKRNLPTALQGDADAVHDARVASRRIREALPLLAAVGLAPPKLVRKARRVTRALGPVRELDVAMAVLSELERRPEHAAAVAVLKETLECRRTTSRGEMLDRLADFDAGRFARRIRKVASRLEESSVLGARAALASRLARRAGDVSSAIDAAGTLYAPDSLHAVRIAAKKLRYALELAHLFPCRETAPALAPLKRAQQVLGRLHDLDVVANLLAGGDSPLDSLARAIEHEERELHAQYLTLRSGIADIAGESRRFALSLCPPRSSVKARPHTEERGKRHQPVPGATRRRGGTRRRVS